MHDVAPTVDYDRNARRNVVKLSLNEDLVARAMAETQNLSATVEQILAGCLRGEQRRKPAADSRLDEVISGLTAP